MPEIVRIRLATEREMPGFFGPLQLEISRDSCDISRVGSAAGMNLLADHQSDRSIGRITRAEIADRAVYMTAELQSTARSEPYLEEMRKELRSGCSPGFILGEVEFKAMDDGQILTLVKSFEIFEASLTSTPKNPDAAILSLEGSPTNKQASHEGAPGVDVSARQRSSARTESRSGSHTSRARASQPTPNHTDRRAKLKDIERRVDEKLGALAEASMAADEREQSVTAARTRGATGEVQPLDEMILSLASLATNPSGTTAPGLEGVTIQALNRNHVAARVPALTAALTGGSTPTITTVERGDVQPSGRRAERILRLFRPASPPYGSQRFPIMDTGATAGMVVDGGPALTIVDGTFRNPAPEATPHMAQVRAKLILSQKVCAGRIRTNVPTPGYNIQSLFRILPQHTVALKCAKSLELPQNGFLRGNQSLRWVS